MNSVKRVATLVRSYSTRSAKIKRATSLGTQSLDGKVVKEQGKAEHGSGRENNDYRAVVDVLESLVRILDRVGDVVPCTPLKIVTAGLLELFGLYQKRADNAEKFAEFLHSMEDLKALLQEFLRPDVNTHPALKNSFGKLVVDFEGYQAEIKIRTEQQRSLVARAKRFLLIQQDVRFLSALAGKITGSVQNLMLELAVRTHGQVNEIDKNVDTILDNQLLQRLHPIEEAAYNGRDRPQCQFDTRKLVLQELLEWARSRDSEQVCWLSGPPGSGKSAIACSFSQDLDQASKTTILLCSFFYSEGDNIRRLVPTLANQLAVRHSPFRSLLKREIEAHDVIGSGKFADQLDHLLFGRLRSLFAHRSLPVVLVIDGLEQCPKRDDIDLVNVFITELVARLPEAPYVKALFTCQPTTRLKYPALGKTLVIGPGTFEVDDDIRRYFTSRLKGLGTTHDQPKRRVNIPKVVQKANGFFRCASYMFDLFRSNYDEFCALLEAEEGLVGLKAVEASYERLLLEALRAEDQTTQHHIYSFLVIIACLDVTTPLSFLNANNLFESERVDFTQLRAFLKRLSGVGLHMLNDDDDAVLVFSDHAFKDFLLERAQVPPDPIVSTSLQHCRIGLSLFEHMDKQLRRNSLHIPPMQSLDTVGNSVRIDPKLRYACQNWAFHLDSGLTTIDPSSGSDVILEVLDALSSFAHHRLLYWIEVLALLRSIPVAVRSLEQAKDWMANMKFIPSRYRDVLIPLLEATLSAIQTCRAVIEEYPCQVYESLLFPSTASTLATTYSHVQPFVAEVEERLMSQEVPTGSDVVICSLSPDNKHIATGHSGGMVKVWVIASGRLLSEARILESGIDRECIVHDVAFIDRRRVMTILLNRQGFYLEVAAWDITQNPARKEVSLEKESGVIVTRAPKLTLSATGQSIAVLVSTAYREAFSSFFNAFGIRAQCLDDRQRENDSPVHHDLASAAYNRTESILVLKAYDGRISIYDAVKLTLLRSFNLLGRDPKLLEPSHIRFSSDNHHFSVFGSSFVAVGKAQQPYGKVFFIPKPSTQVFDAHFSGDDLAFAVAPAPNESGRIDVNRYTLGPSKPCSFVTAATFASDGNVMAIGYKNGAVAMYESPGHGRLLGQHKHSWPGERNKVAHLCFSLDGRYLASTVSSGTTTVRRAMPPTSEPLFKLDSSPGKIYLPIFAFSGDSRHGAGVFRLPYVLDDDLYVEMVALDAKSTMITLRIRSNVSKTGMPESADPPLSMALSEDGSVCAISFTNSILLCRNQHPHLQSDRKRIVEIPSEDVVTVRVPGAGSLSFTPDDRFITSTVGVLDAKMLSQLQNTSIPHDRCHLKEGWIVDVRGSKRSWIPVGKDLVFYASHRSQILLVIGGKLVYIRVRL
ncbi:hypothetical protein PQX77_009053 [Marasmius sp. AFHP31]|nr:hypothetical protein PQX77_009053 [Marasmius sp. AFHP31]